MPIYEIEHNGKVYEVDAETPEKAAAAFSTAPATPTEATKSAYTGPDWLRKIGMGSASVLKGVASVPSSVVDFLGASSGPATMDRLRQVQGTSMPLTQGVQSTFPDFAPQTPKEQLASAAIQGISGAGGVSQGMNLGRQALSMIAGGSGAVGSEIARQRGAGPLAQLGVGVLAGGGVGGLSAGAGRLGLGLSPSFQSGRILASNVGKENIQAVLKKIGQPVPEFQLSSPVPNSGATLAEVVRDIPEGTPLQALQQHVAQTSGGPSTKFNARFMGQEVATEAAKAERRAVTDPMRDTAYQAIRTSGGVPSKPIIDKVDSLLTSMAVAGSTNTRSALATIKSDIAAFTNKSTGMIDPETLYNYKMHGINEAIDKALQGTKPGSVKFAAGQRIEINEAIDEAMDTASGGTWKPYLNEYSTRSKLIDAVTERQAEKYNPLQKTATQGTGSMVSGSPVAPSLLTRETALLNYGMRGRKWLLENKVDNILADMALDPTNPSGLAIALKRQKVGKGYSLKPILLGTASGSIFGKDDE